MKTLIAGLLLTTTLNSYALEPPEVVDHDIPKTLADVTAICKKSLETNTGCATVTIDTRVCFAYLDENGYGATVHCFPNGAEL